METKIIYDDSINQDLIKNLNVSVIGFGSQGHAHALNLHESGVNVTVGLREDSKSATRARDMGLKVQNLKNATESADVVMLLLPDQVMADIYNEQIAPYMKDGLHCFLHMVLIFTLTKLFLEKIYLLQWLPLKDLVTY